MFTKLLLVVATISVVSAFSDEHHFPCPHSDHHPPHASFHGHMDRMHEKLFQDLARDMKAIDDKIQSSCSRHSNRNTREEVDAGRYSLTTPLTGYAASDFRVQIRGRVLFVSARGANHAHYTEVRTLPTFVDVSGSSSIYNGDVLSITFPIKNEASICSLDFNDVTTIVSVSEYDNGLEMRDFN